MGSMLCFPKNKSHNEIRLCPSQNLDDKPSNNHMAKSGSVSASIFEQDTKLTAIKAIASPDVTLKSSYVKEKP